MSYRLDLLDMLNSHKFITNGIDVSFDIMNSPTNKDPSWYEVVACSRKILHGTSIIDQFKDEIQRDLDMIFKNHSEVTNYKIWLYQIPHQFHKNIIRYAKAAK